MDKDCQTFFDHYKLWDLEPKSLLYMALNQKDMLFIKTETNSSPIGQVFCYKQVCYLETHAFIMFYFIKTMFTESENEQYLPTHCRLCHLTEWKKNYSHWMTHELF